MAGTMQIADMTIVNAQPAQGASLGGTYEIMKPLGKGAMGCVFKARHRLMNRMVAVKFLPEELSSDLLAIKRLEREAETLARLDHPNIVSTYDFRCNGSGAPYLVLEYVEGRTLAEILTEEGSLPASRAIGIFKQIASAMEYAHQQGVVHRDLKPQNIMISADDEVKILDFGIAALKHHVQKLTAEGEICGTPHYLSPEQCTREMADNRTDVYCLGVLMFKVLTGKVPLVGKSFYETMNRRMTEDAPRFRQLAPASDVPEALEAIVLECVKRNHMERYQSMQSLLDDLDRCALNDAGLRNGNRQNGKKSGVKLPAGMVGKERTSLIFRSGSGIALALVSVVALALCILAIMCRI